jgi:hypothetical protein
LIIDDIYDIFYNLHKPNELYGDFSFSEFMSNFEELKSKDDAKPYISWLHYCLNSILNWRAQEVTLSQNIANQSESKFMLWGLKQNPEVIIKWITDKINNIIYISHPISEPRREFSKNGSWPPIVSIINNFQYDLLKKNILLVMPTAIDEYRLERDERKSYTMNLKNRWPLSDDVYSILTNNNLINSDIDNSFILKPYFVNYDNKKRSFEKYEFKNHQKDMLNIQDYINGTFNTLEMSIREQLGNRDHLLVRSTNGIIVLEPYSTIDKVTHGGVQKELEYLKQVNASLSTSKRLLCAIFLLNSVEEILKEDNFIPEYRDHLCQIISSNHNIARYKVNKLIDENGQLISKTSSLGPQYITPHDHIAIEENLVQYKNRALKSAFISKTMLLEEIDHEYTMILFIEELNDLHNDIVLNKINDFFTESKNENSWEIFIQSKNENLK